jgi:hypothetical protein
VVDINPAARNLVAALLEECGGGNRNSGAVLAGIKARFAELAATPMTFTPGAFGQFIADETAKWATVVRRSSATVD